MPWRPLPIAFAICVYPFHPTSPSDLPLQLGDELYIIEQGGEEGAWYRGYLVAPPSLLAGLTSSKGQTLEARVFSGIFPRKCVEVRELLAGDVLPPLQENGVVNGQGGSHARNAKPPAPVPMLKVGDETPTSKNEPLVDEIASCLREWHSTNLHEVLLSRQYDVVDELAVLVDRLDTGRRQLLHSVLSQREANDLRHQIVWDLARGNKLLSGEVIVRCADRKGRMLTAEDSQIELSKLQADMSLLDEHPMKLVEHKHLHHLLVSLESTVESEGKAISLTVSVNRRNAQGHVEQISEAFAIDVSGQKPSSKPANSKSTLFTDLNISNFLESPEVSDSLFLVVKLFSNEALRGAQPVSAPAERPSSQEMNSPSSPASHNSPSSPKLGRRSLIWPARRKETDTIGRLTQHNGSQHDLLSTPNGTPNGDGGVVAERKLLKRLVGVGAIELSSLVRNTKEEREEIPLWSADSEGKDLHDILPTLQHAIHQLLPSQSRKYSPAKRASSVTLRLRPFAHRDSRALVQSTPTLLQDVLNTPMTELTGMPTRPRSDIYITLERPVLPPNVMLSHPKLGNCPMPEETALRDLQLTFEVRNAAGERLENCIFPSSNSSGHTAWRSVAVERGETWNQTVRLVIRGEDMPGAHIVASLADASNFPFALCWMPLWEHEAFARDGVHSLALYKYDEQTSSIIGGRGAYLSLPWNVKTKGDAVFGPVAALQLKTRLCSTTFSQDPAILALLTWHDQKSRDIVPILKRSLFVPELELVKLMRKILDAVFEVMAEYGGNEEVEDLAFDLLVTVLGLVHDRRFNLQPLVDEYSKTSFRHPFAFPALTRSFVRLLSHALNNESAKRLRAAAKVGSLLLRFTILARQHQIQKEVGIGIKSHRPTFARDLQAIFVSLNGLTENTAPILVGTKTMLIQNFNSWLPELQVVFSEDELFSVSCKFIDSCAHVGGKLILYKLLLINHITAGPFFVSTEVRSQWQKKTAQWLTPYWGMTPGTLDGWREQIRLCSTIVATLVSQWEAPLAPWMRKLVDSYIALQALPKASGELGTYTPLFSTAYPPQVKTVQHKPSYDEGLIEIGALLATRSPDTAYIPDLPEHELFDLLIDLLGVFNSILDSQAFPSSWLSLHIAHHKSILQSLTEVSNTLVMLFLPEPDEAGNFATELWTLFFTTVIKVVSSNAVALETYPEQKRRAIWRVGGDVREEGARLLGSTWSALGWDTSEDDRQLYGLDKMGGFQVQYVPSLVGPTIVLCLSVHEGLRNVATMILRTMIVSEWTLGQDLGVLQGEILNRLDVLFRTEPINDAVLQKLFIEELLQSFETTTTDVMLREAVKSLVDIVDHLLDLLVVVYSAAVTGEASQIMDTLRLMDFLRDMQKEDIYIAYVHRLADIQSKAGNHAEAGLALRLHAELYDWNPSSDVAAIEEPPLPVQKSFERKEWIYFQMIKHFEDGSAWHYALNAYDELCKEYEYNSFDFAKLARARRASAAIYEKISQGEKQVARYFRVVYRGLGFPASLRDKQFIFEGFPTDHTVNFAERLQKQFPLAQIVGKEAVDDVEGQYLSVIPVQAQKDLTHPVNRRPRISNHIREHFMLEYPRQFTITPRVRNADSSGLATPLVEKIVFTTAEAFPTILRRSEIVKTYTTRLTPVQIALERTMRKTQELGAIEMKVKVGDKRSYKSFNEALNILIRPDSGGSVAEYWNLAGSSLEDESSSDLQAMMDDEQKATKRLTQALRCALMDHALAIRRCLDLSNSRSGPPPVGTELIHVFEKSFAPVLAIIESPRSEPLSQEVDSPLPLVPSAMPSQRNSMMTGQNMNINDMAPLSPTQSVPFSSLDLVMDATTPGIGIGPQSAGAGPGTLNRWPSRLSGLNLFSSSKNKDKGKEQDHGGYSEVVSTPLMSTRTSVEAPAKSSGSLVPPTDGGKTRDRSQDSENKVSKRLSFLGLGSR